MPVTDQGASAAGRRVLLITGPNTGGKTVALKTAGLLALMAQAGLHIPAADGSRAAGLPVALRRHRRRAVDRRQPEHVLGAHHQHRRRWTATSRCRRWCCSTKSASGTDPVEGGALGVAVIDHFRQRGAHVIATTPLRRAEDLRVDDRRASTSAAFGFDPETFAPTYQLIYGSPGRSLALEIAARLGLTRPVIAAARENLSDARGAARRAPRARSIATCARSSTSSGWRRASARRSRRPKRACASAKTRCAQREETFRRAAERGARRRRCAQARREIDDVIAELKAKTDGASRAGRGRGAHVVSTGETGAARARCARGRRRGRRRGCCEPADAAGRDAAPPSRTHAGRSATASSSAASGSKASSTAIHDGAAEVDVRGKRMRASVRDLRVIGGGAGARPRASTSTSTCSRATGSLSELNVIGCTRRRSDRARRDGSSTNRC